MSREPIPMWCFALVLVKRGHRFLLVHERKHEQGWYLPAGRVEDGESFVDAAVRETKEEAGVDIAVEGILQVQHNPAAHRMRVFFLARQIDDTPPKSVADEHTLEARWFTVEELKGVTLRGDEVEHWMRYALTTSPAPLSLLADAAG